MNVIGIDYGTERIGVALGSTETGLSEPLTTVSAHQSPEKIVTSLAATHHASHLVVGISEQRSAQQARQFADRLRKIISVPIHLVDETLSTQEATSTLLHKSRSKRSSSQHAAAAAIILERWMEEKHQHC